MHFFLHEIVARVVAGYLAMDSCQKIRRGLIERKINSFNPDWLDWFTYVNSRDANPVMYWTEIVIQSAVFLSCAAVAIFGWPQP
jgi:hypothetical protein